MASTHLILFCCFFALTFAQRWGPGVFFTTRNEVVGLSTVLTPGYPPASEQDFVAIWPGLWNGKMSGYDLVQAVTSSHERKYMQSFCGAKPGQWYVITLQFEAALRRTMWA
jgi:hypothetical protein